MTTKNVDDLLFKDTQQKLGNMPEVKPEQPDNDEPEGEIEHEEPEQPEAEAPEPDNEAKTQPSQRRDAKEPTAESDSKEVTSTEQSASVDEYGNPVAKPKLYTDEDVQRMMRERLSRGNHQQQPVQQQPPPDNRAADGFEVDPNNPNTWEQQLEEFIDKTIQKKQGRAQREAMEREEIGRQNEFETKFNAGIGRYSDFMETVKGKPLTDSMMMATRNMKDPAAFVYAACKSYAKELQQIASIPDPYYQAAEIGRLEERMKKAKAISKAPRPLSNIKGDMLEKNVKVERMNIDARIQEHAKSKRK